MKKLFTLLILVIGFSLQAHGDNPIDKIIDDLETAIYEFNLEKESTLNNMYLQLDSLSNGLEPEDINAKVTRLEKLITLKDDIESFELLNDLEITKLRYVKGIELIKMIYEKILGLDHHFTSLRTFQNISDLTNPNSFPDFLKAKENITSKLDKKKTPNIPNILESNPFVSLTVSLVSTFLGDGNKKEKEESLDQVSCILDFSVKMHSDLNLIYYETEFLKESNQNLKEDAIILFKDYTNIIDYHTTLGECRSNDDWDNLLEKLDQKIIYISKAMKTDSEYERTKLIKTINNLEFSIDRLLNFMDRYINFIIEGEQYYSKFEIILGNYKNESVCLDYLPHQYEDLKRDVNNSILKFTEAYSISEIKGTKLRDLLYGMPY